MDRQNNQNYDNFIYDLNADLMPYIEAGFSVATGRENTAISGFSMGGRESLYIGMKCADQFGFVGSVCTAPGVTDLVPEAEFGFSPMPQLLMISAAVNDGVVGTNPEYYHNLYTRNGVPHLWNQLPYGGHDASSVTPHLYNFMRCIFQSTVFSKGETVLTAAQSLFIDKLNCSWYTECSTIMNQGGRVYARAKKTGCYHAVFG